MPLRPPTFDDPPPSAAWHHDGGRTGFEVVVIGREGGGWRLEGQTTALEDGAAWAVGYVVVLDRDWLTTGAQVRSTSDSGSRELRVDSDGAGSWRVDGVHRPDLEGCLDIDLESSACTNTLPVHRLGLSVGAGAAVPASYVRVPGLEVERLEQRYVRAADQADRLHFDYAAPSFDFHGRLVYDRAGLITDYPGIARRAG